MAEAKLLFRRALQAAKEFKENDKRQQAMLNRAYAALGVMEEDRKNWKGAGDYYKTWVAADPESVVAHQRYARALFQAGDPEAAEKEFKAAKKIDDKTPPPAIAMANLYRLAKDKAKANAKFEEAEKSLKSKDDFNTRIAVATWLWQDNRLKEAREHAEAALKLQPDSAEAKRTLGFIAHLTKDYDTAQKYLEEAHVASPANFQGNNQLALVLIEKDDEADRKRALEYAELNSRLYPNSTEATATLGWIHYRLKRSADAERAFTTVITGGNFSADTAYFLAMALKDQKQSVETAKKLLTQTLNSDQVFAYRDDAEKLLKTLNKSDKPPAEGPEKAGSGKSPSPKRTRQRALRDR